MPVSPLYNWRVDFGDKLLGFSVGRGLGALNGSSPKRSLSWAGYPRYLVTGLLSPVSSETCVLVLQDFPWYTQAMELLTDLHVHFFSHFFVLMGGGGD